MCYNLAFLEKSSSGYAKRFIHTFSPGWSADSVPETLEVHYFASGFAHPVLPIVHNNGVMLSVWGLVPGWVKSWDKAMEIRSKTLNTVGETAFEKPSFRLPIRKQRAILGVSGFFEWREYMGTKYPYFIHDKNGELLSLGAVYDNWHDPKTGTNLFTFSIVTTAANPLLEKIHNLKKRMPLILPREKEAAWIDPETSAQEVSGLIVPYNNPALTAYSISRIANNSRVNRNTPNILDRELHADLPDL